MKCSATVVIKSYTRAQKQSLDSYPRFHCMEGHRRRHC